MIISFLIAVSFVGAFFWANRKSQFSNLDLEALKILEYKTETINEEKKWNGN